MLCASLLSNGLLTETWKNKDNQVMFKNSHFVDELITN